MEQIQAHNQTVSPSNTENTINLDAYGQELLGKQMDSVKSLFSEVINMMNCDDDTSVLSIRKQKFFPSEDKRLPPYILTVKIDTTVIDRLINPDKVSLMTSVVYFDGVNEPSINTTVNSLLDRAELSIPNDIITKDTCLFLKSQIAKYYKLDGEYDTSLYPNEQDAKRLLQEKREQIDEEQKKLISDLYDLKDKVVDGVRRFAVKALGTTACVVGGAILTFTALSIIRKRLR